MKLVYGNCRILFISLILAVFLSGSALADVQLDLGSAPLYPGDEEVYPGDEVKIPIFLSNYPGGPIVAGTSNKITYDSDYLIPLVPTLGPAGQVAGKNIRSNITDPGLYIVGVLGTTDQNLKTPIPDGIVVYARFRVSASAPAGTYILENKAGCTDADGTDIPVSGTDGFIDVSGSNSSTTTTEPVTTIPITSSTTTTEPVTTILVTSTTTTFVATTTMPSTTTSIEAGVCTITINPSAISVASTETMHFTATATGTDCNNPQLAWSVDGDIGSTIDDDGNYQAGENNTGEEVTDTVLVIDYANKNISATATVSISALPVEGITRITPETIHSSRRRARLHLLIIRSDQVNFKNTSKLSFNPAGEINPLATMAAGRIMIAFISVKPNVQGQYDVTVATDTMIYTKKDGLNVTIAPMFSSKKIK